MPTSNEHPNPAWQEVGSAQIVLTVLIVCYLRRHRNASSNVSELGQFHLPADNDAYIDVFSMMAPFLAIWDLKAIF
jgi:hypothetical protein